MWKGKGLQYMCQIMKDLLVGVPAVFLFAVGRAL